MDCFQIWNKIRSQLLSLISMILIWHVSSLISQKPENICGMRYFTESNIATELYVPIHKSPLCFIFYFFYLVAWDTYLTRGRYFTLLVRYLLLAVFLFSKDVCMNNKYIYIYIYISRLCFSDYFFISLMLWDRSHLNKWFCGYCCDFFYSLSSLSLSLCFSPSLCPITPLS